MASLNREDPRNDLKKVMGAALRAVGRGARGLSINLAAVTRLAGVASTVATLARDFEAAS